MIRRRGLKMALSLGVWVIILSQNGADAGEVRKQFMDYIAQYPLPDAATFGQDRIARATKKYPWPSLHPSMTHALKQQDNWMNNERRLRE